MPTASQIISKDARKSISMAVSDAESRTSCEIVPVIATASGCYDRAENLIGLCFGVVGVTAAWYLAPRLAFSGGDWESPAASMGMELALLLGALLVGYFLGTVIGGRVDGLRRLFVGQKQRREEVESRASSVFFDHRVHHTAGASGLLLYVSLFEHTAVVYGDQRILDHEQLGQVFLDNLCAKLIQGIRTGNIAEAMKATIADAGEILGEVLPREHVDVNELEDVVVLLD